MSMVATTGIARRRANVRRGVIAALVIACLAIFTGYFRESTERSVARSAVDRRERRGAGGSGHPAVGPSATPGMGEQPGLTPATGPPPSSSRSTTCAAGRPTTRCATSASPSSSRCSGSRRSSTRRPASAAIGSRHGPVVSPLDHRLVPQRAHLGGLVEGRGEELARGGGHRPRRRARGHRHRGLLTARRGLHHRRAHRGRGHDPRGRQPPGLVQSTTPGQLQLTGVPRSSPVKVNQDVVTSGFMVKGAPVALPLAASRSGACRAWGPGGRPSRRFR